MRDVFPTPLSPMKTTLTIIAGCSITLFENDIFNFDLMINSEEFMGGILILKIRKKAERKIRNFNNW